MDNKLIQFDIIGLHGIRDYSIKLDDNKVIIVGENGSGKTTIFKIMYYTLSCDWDSLRTFDFEYVVIHFSCNNEIKISMDLLKRIYEIDEIDRIPYYMESRYYNRRRHFTGFINTLIDLKRETEGKNEIELDRYFNDSPFPYKYIEGVTGAAPLIELYKITKQIEDGFDAKIVYLPTYRRIEEQLKNIFPRMDKDDWEKARRSNRSRSIELIEFGMSDVESAVKEYQERLNNFSRAQQNKLTLGYLSEIIGEEYEKFDAKSIKELTEQQICDILKRIEANILSDDQKKEIVHILSQIRNTLEAPIRVREKIICHYFLKLVGFDKELREEELPLINFIDKCNKYLLSNSLVYDNQNFSCSIINKVDGYYDAKNEIHFQDMSSGEKQIVSLFSHLNLSQTKKMFVFIDEPELSLSVDWQRMILVDILDSISCIGLIATTHSPFVFENELEKYIHGINEFRIRG